MTAATLDQPTTQETGQDRPAHWCCILQDSLPLIGLCGELPFSQRRKGHKVTCRKCLAQVSEHITTCWVCRPLAAKYHGLGE